jgi:U4/U6.U5 tri-snRNP-associated protein 1
VFLYCSLLKNTDHLSGVKVLHGLDKVLEGGAVVMTLKDQSILADGDINEGSMLFLFFTCFFLSDHFLLTPPVIICIEGDMLENILIGEQKQRDNAYKAARKKETYDDK